MAKWAGYFTIQGKLCKIEVAGGLPTVLADAHAGKGGTWNRDGVILFTPDSPNQPIYRVSSSGGAVTAVTKLDPSRGDNSHRFPEFLPDGRHFLYLARGAAGAGELRVGSLDGATSQTLMPAESQAVYAAGYLLFTQANSLVARPFDTANLRFTGDPVPLAASVLLLRSAYRGVFSASQNGVLVYLAGAISQLSDLSWFDRTGARPEHLATAIMYPTLIISPDQRRVAAITSGEGGAENVSLLDLPHGVPTRFSPAGEFALNPVWAPDGTGVIYVSQKGQSTLTYKPIAAGGRPQVVGEVSSDSYPYDWSRDGRHIVYVNAQGYWLLPVEGLAPPKAGKPSLLVRAVTDYATAAFSPDSKWLAYDARDGSHDEVFITNVPDGDRKWQVSVGGGGYPRWRRDGKELYYLGADGKMMAAAVQWTGDVPEFQPPKPLFDTHHALTPSTAYDVAADGQRFLMAWPETSTERSMLTLVTNWTAQLKK